MTKMQTRDWWCDEEWEEVAQTTISTQDDDEPRWSGLYDQYGNKLIREPIPFGFRRTND